MAKKYIYSEKKVIKEFVGSLISKILVNKHSKIVQKLIKNDPLIAKLSKNVDRIAKDISRDIERKRKENPDYDREYQKIDKIFKSIGN